MKGGGGWDTVPENVVDDATLIRLGFLFPSELADDFFWKVNVVCWPELVTFTLLRFVQTVTSGIETAAFGCWTGTALATTSGWATTLAGSSGWIGSWIGNWWTIGYSGHPSGLIFKTFSRSIPPCIELINTLSEVWPVQQIRFLIEPKSTISFINSK